MSVLSTKALAKKVCLLSESNTTSAKANWTSIVPIMKVVSWTTSTVVATVAAHTDTPKLIGSSIYYHSLFVSLTGTLLLKPHIFVVDKNDPRADIDRIDLVAPAMADHPHTIALIMGWWSTYERHHDFSSGTRETPSTLSILWAEMMVTVRSSASVVDDSGSVVPHRHRRSYHYQSTSSVDENFVVFGSLMLVAKLTVVLGHIVLLMSILYL